MRKEEKRKRKEREKKEERKLRKDGEVEGEDKKKLMCRLCTGIFEAAAPFSTGFNRGGGPFSYRGKQHNPKTFLNG
jgi:hypothetical protein